ncbi:MAG: OmpA family protein [Spirochaetota bacterium]|nr:OmpA family protein [Spirochaetota bacterium]
MNKKGLWSSPFLSIFLAIFIFLPSYLNGSDWPIYKGNIYFTGNNDEIIVKNNNLKWLFQADERTFNPIVSDDHIFFIDKKSMIYCLDEEYGKLLWKTDIKKISSQFKAFSRAAGKVKYPLISGNLLFLTDPIAIYAFDKRSGAVIWARTGMRIEKTKPQGLSGRAPLPMVDGIYSNPIIHENKVFYGTRNMFLSRGMRRGDIKWDNRDIKSYSGFPTFYDDMLFTQSMNYEKGHYIVHCIKEDTGKEVWSIKIEKPLKIFPPVVYKKNAYISSNKSLFCVNLKTGEKIWIKEYDNYITSNLSFTDRSILFSIGNSDIAVINPDNGNILQLVKVGYKSSPYFVTTRDQIYIAYNEQSLVKNRRITYGRLKAVNFSDNQTLWKYKTPFPGAVSQPVSSKGILFLPAGNYIYAIGTEYYSRPVDGGSGYAVVPDKKGRDAEPPQPRIHVQKPHLPKEIEIRELKIAIKDKNNQPLKAQVEIKKRDRGKVVYSKRMHIDKSGIIDVPKGDNVELLVTSKGYLPKKETLREKDKEKNIILDKIERGKSFVVNNILFEFDKAYLKKESLDILDKLIGILKINKALKVEIRGHTDSVGEEEYNQKLSERRADSVAEYMIKNGISPERLRSIGFGELKPIATNKTKEGRILNRRTEFYIH